MKNLILIVLLFSLFVFSSQKKDDYSVEQAVNTVAQIIMINDSEPVQIFDTLLDFSIISFKQVSDYPSSDTDTTKCIDWNLTDDNIKQIIQSSRLINKHEWHYLFSHLPCAATGQINQNELIFDFSINSGSWMTIGNSDTTIMLGYFDTELAELFLDKPWTEDDK